jgi:hypothetical protein
MKFMQNKNTTLIISLLGVYLFVSGISWAVFSYLRTDATPEQVAQNVSDNRAKIDPDLPKTESCPLNGKMFSKPERDIWETRRPMAVSVENHADARPQSGLSSADIVYEVVAEGGITRFLSVFYCGVAAKDTKIAPIRSARVYLINWAAEYGKDPIFVHVGGANNICKDCPGGTKSKADIDPSVDAFKLLDTLGWRGAKGNAFDGGTNVGYPIIVRDQYRLGSQAAWEHSVVGSSDKLFDEAKLRGFGAKEEDAKPWDATFVSWKFKDEAPSASPSVQDISFEFWKGQTDYNVSWKYDKTQNAYLRSNGGKPHVDHETEKQIATKNVIVMEVEEKGPVDKEKHMFYTTIGKGNAYIFQNGEMAKGTWEKKTQLDRTKFFDSKGTEISFIKGQIWIEAIPKGNEVKYN